LSELRGRLGVEVRSDVRGDLETLPEAYAIMLYRGVEHAVKLFTPSTLPQRAALTLLRGDNGIELRIDLDGAAMLADSQPWQLDHALLQERALRLNGEYIVAERGNNSIRLRLSLPCEAGGTGRG